MSKKFTIWICSISAAIFATVAVLLLCFLPSGAPNMPSESPPVSTPGDTQETANGPVSIDQSSNGAKGIISVKYKSSKEEEFESIQTTNGQSKLDLEEATNDKLVLSEKNMHLSLDNPYIIFEFTIENEGQESLAAGLDLEAKGASVYSVKYAFSHDGEKFSHDDYGLKANSGISILPDETERYYVKIALNAYYTEVVFEGKFSWSVSKITEGHTVRIGSTSYATIFDAYNNSKANDIICLLKDISTTQVFNVDKPLSVFADRDVVWTTNAVSGIVVGNYSMYHGSSTLLLGCDNGNKLTVKSDGGYNAIYMGTSSLYLAADVICGTEEATPDCVGIRKVGYYDFHNALNFYGGSISKFYYGIVDMTQETSYHNYYWGEIYDCVEGIHADVGGGSGMLPYDYSKFTFGTKDKKFYLYSCDDYLINFSGEIRYDILGHAFVPANWTKIDAVNLVLGEDDKGNVAVNKKDLVGSAIVITTAELFVSGYLQCNSFTQTPIYIGDDAWMSCGDSANVQLKNNQGTAGAAIQAVEYSDVLLKNATISGNKSTQSGGAIYMQHGDLSLTNCVVENNSSGNMGGAILSESGKIEIKNSLINNNSATSSGGAIYSQGNLTIVNSKLYNNSTTGDGGAIFIVGVGTELIELTISEGSEIYNNTAKTRGGAVRIGEDVQADIEETKIYGNKVKSSLEIVYGGGLFVSSGGELNLVSCEVYNNAAEGLYSLGGNIFVAGEYEDKNTSEITPAGVFYAESTKIYSDGTSSQANAGGGLANNGMCYMIDSQIENCIADYASGIVNSGTMFITNVKISSTETAAKIGKAIANVGSLYLGYVQLEGEGMDITMVCTKRGVLNPTYQYAKLYAFHQLIDEELNDLTYKLSFATFNETLYTAKTSTDLPEYYRTNGLPIVSYEDFEGVKFNANPNNFVSDGYNFVLSDDGYGLLLAAK